jgi:uncharacterized protein
MTDIAVMYHDSAYLHAVNTLWDNMVNKKMYLTGGIGSKHEGEAFGENYELPNRTAYNETCAAIGSVYWNQRLFLLSGDSKYYDIIERTLYNGLLAGISLDGKKFFYPNPLESDGTYRFNMGSCTRQSWFDCSCCPTNLIRFVPSIPGLIYAAQKDSLYINLFMSNKAHIPINGTMVEIVQHTDYPWKGQVAITVNPEKRAVLTVKLRIPGWAQNVAVPGDLYNYGDVNSESAALRMNGKNLNYIINKGYLEITKEWAPGDNIELTLPMKARKVFANQKVQEDRNMVAFEYGPLVYCAEEIDNDKHTSNVIISDDIDLRMSKRTILSETVNSITAKIHGNYPNSDKDIYNLTLIPYYIWSNRGVGKMNVWFPSKIE